AHAVEFGPGVHLSTKAAQALRAQAEALVDLAERNGPNRLSPLAAANHREVLLDALLAGQRHSFSDAIAIFSGHVETLPRALKRARDCLHATATEPLDLAQLAEAAGIGIR